jgi:hypothetical protein
VRIHQGTESECGQKVSSRIEGIGSQLRAVELAFHLLGEHAAAESDAALEGDGGKVSAAAALGFRPGLHGRNQPRNGCAHETEKAEVSADSLNAAAIFRTLGTKLQELHNASEVFSGCGAGNASDITHFRRQSLLRGGRDERAAVGNKELQQQHDGADENESGHHRGTTASREGASRASSEIFQKAYAQASGRRHAETGVK